MVTMERALSSLLVAQYHHRFHFEHHFDHHIVRHLNYRWRQR
jgi:hypothetical protein